MMDLIANLISGLSLGSIYALIALGYTMVYGIAKMLNFAHGDIIMVGAFAVVTTVSMLGFPPILAIAASIVCCVVLGVCVERIAYKPLRKSPLPQSDLRAGHPARQPYHSGQHARHPRRHGRHHDRHEPVHLQIQDR